MNHGLTFDRHRYISLETTKRDGTAVRTPVWFATDPGETGVLYVYSTADAGKVKRIKRNRAVRIARCDMRGQITGPWADGRASLATGEIAALGMSLLDRKYWPWKQVLNLVARIRRGHQRTIIRIVVDQFP